MIGASKPMDYGVPCQQGIKRSVIKVGTSITSDSMGHAKSSKDILPKELHNDFSIISPKGDSLNPFRNIVHN